jgi:hypothetical protein
MGDEAFAVFLPWIVFAVVDRWDGQGVTWGAIGALITVAALAATSTRDFRSPNAILRGAAIWFTLLAIAGFLYGSPNGFIGDHGRAIADAGFAVIAFGSLAFTPISEHYIKLRVRPRLWKAPGFGRLNTLITMIWGTTFALIAFSCFVATWVDSKPGYTVFAWVVPIALGTIAVHRSRIAGEDFIEQSGSQLDSHALFDLALGLDASHYE